MITKVQPFLKYVDQPLLLKTVSENVPKVLIGGAAAYGLYDTFQAPKGERKDRFIKNASVLGLTVGSALIATNGLKGVFKGLVKAPSTENLPKAISRIRQYFSKALAKGGENIEAIRSSQKVAEGILTHAESRPLNPGEISKLGKALEVFGKRGERLLNGKRGLIPDPKKLNSKQIFGEIFKLSSLGAIPIIGGILGGTIGDMATHEPWQKKSTDRVKEGAYQFLANICLCNVGAGLALAGLEAAKIRNPVARAVGMSAGVLSVGVLGGSTIANFLAKNFINPACDKGLVTTIKDIVTGNQKLTFKNLNDERHPEALDVGLHADDFATVGVLSGVKWIELLLPGLYSISGYRAGIGYRNNTSSKEATNPGSAKISQDDTPLKNSGVEEKGIHTHFHNNDFSALGIANKKQTLSQDNPYAFFENYSTSSS